MMLTHFRTGGEHIIKTKLEQSRIDNKLSITLSILEDCTNRSCEVFYSKANIKCLLSTFTCYRYKKYDCFYNRTYKTKTR